ncbi:YVTN family beta-propeller protein [Williamsia limnetica]|uniref:YVTN family beta-propeller protein n=1 Tax=Williamsia limnetica TaxID=882452 RepID=A0A318RFT8_WILLI|nr:YncE family protein [Williamsia limnetica]PYE12904.1 YVTN family beta-propeller protein [Williamsia limnetica]
MAAVAVLTAVVTSVSTAGVSHSDPGLRDVLIVGNNWEGTADVLTSTAPYTKMGRINAIPDKDERLREIFADPVKSALFLGIRYTVGEGHDQYIDDIYATADGQAVVLSRPSFADVVSIDLASGKILWRFPVSGARADHMAISPDGHSIAVSASTSNTVHVIDVATGKQQGRFGTGDKPHENVYTNGGRYLWNMSIGEVNTPLDAPALDATKGDRKITVVDTTTFRVVRTIDMRQRLDAIGRRDLSDAVRPVAFSPDEKTMYFQVSFFAGLVEYDVASDTITRVVDLPKNPATSPDRTRWVNDSRHHGLSMNTDGSQLCVAGTMDDYVTIVDRRSLTPGPLVRTAKPYWATVNGDSTDCIISESESDTVSAISFSTGQRTAQIPVGDHPQRIRLGKVSAAWTGNSEH